MRPLLLLGEFESLASSRPLTWGAGELAPIARRIEHESPFLEARDDRTLTSLKQPKCSNRAFRVKETQTPDCDFRGVPDRRVSA
jgi:hypothetical protein